MIILEMTAYYKAKNMTLVDALDALYKKCQDADDEKAKAAVEDALKGKDDKDKDDKDGKKDDKAAKKDDKAEGENKDGCG